MTNEPRAILALRLPQSLLDELDAWAYKHDRARVNVIRAAIAAYIGSEHTDVHGNTKYTTDEQRRAANALAVKKYKRNREYGKA